MKIIILTTHPISLPSIQALEKNNLLAGVVTASQNKDLLNRLKPIIRKSNIPFLQLNERKLEQQFSVFLKKQKTDVVLVYGFAHKITTKLLQIPKWGFINFHPSQLPQFRGANPAFWQIKNQVKTGGITAHKMDKNWDRGAIIGMFPIPIAAEMTASHYLSEAGFYAAQLMNMIVQALQIGQLPSQTQDESKATYQKRPKQKDFQINWEEQSFEEIRALVNACNRDLGGAITFLRNNPLQLLQVSLAAGQTEEKVGTIMEIKPLIVACTQKQLLKIEIVQVAEGIMTGTQFAVMAQLKKGEIFD